MEEFSAGWRSVVEEMADCASGDMNIDLLSLCDQFGVVYSDNVEDYFWSQMDDCTECGWSYTHADLADYTDVGPLCWRCAQA